MEGFINPSKKIVQNGRSYSIYGENLWDKLYDC